MNLINCSLLLVTFFLTFAPLFSSAQTPCTLCLFSVQFVDGYLKQNETQEEIIKQFQMVCALLPSPYEKYCVAYVQIYVPQVIAWLRKEEDPMLICTQLGLCPDTEPLKLMMSRAQSLPVPTKGGPLPSMPPHTPQ